MQHLLFQTRILIEDQEVVLEVRTQEVERIKKKRLANPLRTLVVYLSTTVAAWYWITITLTSITTVFVFVIPEQAYPLVYFRYTLGFFFVLYFPGFAFVKALLPANELEDIERLCLSIGVSIALVPLVALLLNYTPWGLQTTPLTMGLLILTITLATIGFTRESKRKMQRTRI